MAKYSYNDANKALKAVVDYMDGIKNVWAQGRNLKLYDASYKAGELVDKYPRLKEEYDTDALFNDFCEISYRQFEEFMQENGITDPRVYVGRTSTFYLTDVRDDTPVGVLYNLLTKVNENVDVDINDDLTVAPFTSDYYDPDELMDELGWQLEYIVEEFMDDVKKYMEDAVKVAEYIDAFKEAQVENFDEYMQFEEDVVKTNDEFVALQFMEAQIQAGVEAIQYTV